MKGLSFIVALVVTLLAGTAFAGGFGVTSVAVNGRGFNTLAVNGVGASVTQVNGFGRRSTTVANNGLGTTVIQQRNGGLFPVFGRRNSTTVINNGVAVNGAAFVPAGFNVLAVNGRQLNAFNTGFNAFGTTAFTDAAGNVFEADAFGNTVFRGNAFNRGFGVNGFSTFNSGVFLQSNGFVPAGGFQVRSFGCR